MIKGMKNRRKTISGSDLELFLSDMSDHTFGLSNENVNIINRPREHYATKSNGLLATKVPILPESQPKVIIKSIDEDPFLHDIRKFCKNLFQSEKIEANSKTEDLARGILLKTEYPILPTRVLHSERYVHPSHTIESKRAVLLALTSSLSVAEADRKSESETTQNFTRCKVSKLKTFDENGCLFRYIDMDKNVTVPYEEYELRYSLYLNSCKRTKDLLRKRREATIVPTPVVTRPVVPTPVSLPVIPTPVVEVLVPIKSTSESEFLEIDLDAPTSIPTAHKSNRRETLSPRTSRAALMDCVNADPDPEPAAEAEAIVYNEVEVVLPDVDMLAGKQVRDELSSETPDMVVDAVHCIEESSVLSPLNCSRKRSRQASPLFCNTEGTSVDSFETAFISDECEVSSSTNRSSSHCRSNRRTSLSTDDLDDLLSFCDEGNVHTDNQKVESSFVPITVDIVPPADRGDYFPQKVKPSKDLWAECEVISAQLERNMTPVSKVLVTPEKPDRLSDSPASVSPLATTLQDLPYVELLSPLMQSRCVLEEKLMTNVSECLVTESTIVMDDTCANRNCINETHVLRAEMESIDDMKDIAYAKYVIRMQMARWKYVYEICAFEAAHLAAKKLLGVV